MPDVDPTFVSVLGLQMQGFLEQKRSLGHHYRREAQALWHLDRFLDSVGHTDDVLPKEIVERWTAAHAGERAASQAKRVSLARQFAGYLRQRGVAAYVPPEWHGPARCDEYLPHIFSREEIARFMRAADAIRPEGHSPERYRVMPMIFRILYGCGLRGNEALQLTNGDVDLGRGVLTIRDAKFRKDRLVPVAEGLMVRLRDYAARLPSIAPDAFFLPSPTKGAYALASVYHVFRHILFDCGISHRGRGAGPRLHDFRHTFAVHALERWYREGADLNAKLPYLSAYMGHRGLDGTIRYLRLTPHVFPDITKRMEAFAGAALPQLPQGIGP